MKSSLILTKESKPEAIFFFNISNNSYFLGVVGGHLVVHKSRHELCLRVKSEFNGNKVVPQDNLTLQLSDV